MELDKQMVRSGGGEVWRGVVFSAAAWASVLPVESSSEEGKGKGLTGWVGRRVLFNYILFDYYYHLLIFIVLF